MDGDYDKQDESKELRGAKHYGQKHTPNPRHYYGDAVREFLFATGIVMIVGLPIFSAQINFPIFLAVLGILVVNLVAGLTNPKQRVTILIDGIVSFIGLMFFELIAFFQFDTFHNWWSWYFWFNQVLAILFFTALYFSVKTYRGMVIPAIDEGEDR